MALSLTRFFPASRKISVVTLSDDSVKSKSDTNDHEVASVPKAKRAKTTAEMQQQQMADAMPPASQVNH